MGSLARQVDEAGVRIAEMLFTFTEDALTEVIKEGCYDAVAEAGEDSKIAELIEARMRYAITASLARRFMQAAAGWNEVHGFAAERFLDREDESDRDN